MLRDYKIIEETESRFTYECSLKFLTIRAGFLLTAISGVLLTVLLPGIIIVPYQNWGHDVTEQIETLMACLIGGGIIILVLGLPLTTVEIDRTQSVVKITRKVRWFRYIRTEIITFKDIMKVYANRKYSYGCLDFDKFEAYFKKYIFPAEWDVSSSNLLKKGLKSCKITEDSPSLFRYEYWAINPIYLCSLVAFVALSIAFSIYGGIFSMIPLIFFSSILVILVISYTIIEVDKDHETVKKINAIRGFGCKRFKIIAFKDIKNLSIDEFQPRKQGTICRLFILLQNKKRVKIFSDQGDDARSNIDNIDRYMREYIFPIPGQDKRFKESSERPYRKRNKKK